MGRSVVSMRVRRRTASNMLEKPLARDGVSTEGPSPCITQQHCCQFESLSRIATPTVLEDGSYVESKQWHYSIRRGGETPTVPIQAEMTPTHQASQGGRLHGQHLLRREARQRLHQHRRQAAGQRAVAVTRQLHAAVGIQARINPGLWYKSTISVRRG